VCIHRHHLAVCDRLVRVFYYMKEIEWVHKLASLLADFGICTLHIQVHRSNFVEKTYIIVAGK